MSAIVRLWVKGLPTASRFQTSGSCKYCGIIGGDSLDHMLACTVVLECASRIFKYNVSGLELVGLGSVGSVTKSVQAAIFMYAFVRSYCATRRGAEGKPSDRFWVETKHILGRWRLAHHVYIISCGGRLRISSASIAAARRKILKNKYRGDIQYRYRDCGMGNIIWRGIDPGRHIDYSNGRIKDSSPSSNDGVIVGGGKHPI